jgi:hypothetical protein
VRRVIVCLISSFLLQGLSASAQQAPATPAAGSNWRRVQALPTGMSLYINTKGHHTRCTLKGVAEDTLSCNHGKDLLFQRSEIQSVKISRRGRSTLVAAGIGIGVGAIVGVASGSSCTAAEKSSFLGCFMILSRGDMALIGGAVGGVVGAPIGLTTDMTRSTVYKAP